MGMDDAYKMINQTLVSLINEIWELEEKAIITDEFTDKSSLVHESLPILARRRK